VRQEKQKNTVFFFHLNHNIHNFSRNLRALKQRSIINVIDRRGIARRFGWPWRTMRTLLEAGAIPGGAMA
jgi:hypothetical protein